MKKKKKPPVLNFVQLDVHCPEAVMGNLPVYSHFFWATDADELGRVHVYVPRTFLEDIAAQLND